MYVYGYRCLEHQYVEEPSQTLSGDGYVGCYGRALLKPRPVVPPPAADPPDGAR